MELPLALIVIGILVAVGLDRTIGVILAVAGVALLLLGGDIRT